MKKKIKQLYEKFPVHRSPKFIGTGIVALLVGFFLIVSSEVQEAASGEQETITYIDTALLKFIASFRTPALNSIAVDFTALGSTTVLTLVTIVFVILMTLRKRFDLVGHIILASCSAGFLSGSLKLFFGRERPTVVEKLVYVQNHSYPSGHSLASAAIYLTLTLVLCRLLPTNFQRGIVLVVAATIVGLIGVSRIYLGVHYPSDVLAGFLIGTSLAVLLAAFASKYESGAEAS